MARLQTQVGRDQDPALKTMKKIYGPSGGVLPSPPAFKNNWVTDCLPDSDLTVLIRTNDDEFPVWPGFHDGEAWRSCTADEIQGIVLGWMTLEQAAEALDKKMPDVGRG